MKTVKIDFLGFWPNFDKKNNIFTNTIAEKYCVEISEEPDFVIVSPFGKPYDYLRYDCVRILFTGEPLTPDFNVFDYAIGFDYMECMDAEGKNRYYRYPLSLISHSRLEECSKGMTYSEAKAELEKKRWFCNFLYGHRSAYGERERMFEVVQSYKRVESAGSFMNNMPGGMTIPYSDKKLEFLNQCKFTIACESISRPGFVTEKLIDPLCSHTIPIYYGDPCSIKEFNSEAIINCHNYASFEEALERVKELDQDDEQYIKMLMQPKMINDQYLTLMRDGFKEFLWRIVSQDKESAYRRMRHYISKEHENHLKIYNQFYGSFWYKIFMKIHK